MDELKKIIEQASSPVDVAIVLLAGAVGFLLDAGLNVVGFLEPGYVGVVAASAALGLKKAAEAGFAKSRERKIQERKRQAEIKRAVELRTLLGKDAQYLALAEQLEQEQELFVRGIIDAENFKTSVDKVIKAYRDRQTRQLDI